MVYDWRGDQVPGTYRCIDADTGEEVRAVFFYDTETNRVGRYLLNENGRFFVSAAGPSSVASEVAKVWETRRLVMTPVRDMPEPDAVVGA